MRTRHDLKTPTEYNDDTAYRRLVAEMLDAKKQALMKMDYLLANADFLHYLKCSLRLSFRTQMGRLSRDFKSNPTRDKAIDLRTQFGLVGKDIAEVDDFGETPLFTACADGVMMMNLSCY